MTRYTEGFSHFVTSMTAPVASGWSLAEWGLHPLENAALPRRTPETDIDDAGCLPASREQTWAGPAKPRELAGKKSDAEALTFQRLETPFSESAGQE